MSARILVVDDEEPIRFTFERFLKTEGHLVTTAESCGEALARIDETNFDVVFADIILGDGTGIDILREIRARGLNCPVIMITGDPGVETAADSVRLDAFDYIPKPINQESLLHAAQTALKYKALHEEKEKYRTNLEAIFRSVRDAIVTVDKEGVVSEFNEAAMTMFGYSRNDIGKAFSSLPEICEGRCAEIFAEAIEREAPVEADRLECRPANSAKRVISVRTYPLIGPQSSLAG
jgi:PAS domain S-box-containing protein